MRLVKPYWVSHDGMPIFSIDIHPDNTRFATGGQGKDCGLVGIWNFAPVIWEDAEFNENVPKMLCYIDSHLACVNCVRWSGSGKYLASGGDDKLVMIWKCAKSQGGNAVFGSKGKVNSETWRCAYTLRGHSGDILDLAWSPQDLFLATASVDNTIIIWDAAKLPNIVTILKGHTGLVKGVTWDPVGKYLSSQSEDKSLRVWRTQDWQTETVIEKPFEKCSGTTAVLRHGWSPDGQYLVTAHSMNNSGPTSQIIERNGWKHEKDYVGHRKAVTCVRFSNNILQKKSTYSKKLKQMCVCALGSRDHGISVWLTGFLRPLVVLEGLFQGPVLDLSWSSDSAYLLACSYDGSITACIFTESEIGKSLTSRQKDQMFEKVYGTLSVLSSQGCAQLIENPDILSFIEDSEKRQKIENEESDVKITPSKLNAPVLTKQIETRMTDGRRRITPIFIPSALDFDETSAQIGSENPSNKSESSNICPVKYEPSNSNDLKMGILSEIENSDSKILVENNGISEIPENSSSKTVAENFSETRPKSVKIGSNSSIESELSLSPADLVSESEELVMSDKVIAEGSLENELKKTDGENDIEDFAKVKFEASKMENEKSVETKKSKLNGKFLDSEDSELDRCSKKQKTDLDEVVGIEDQFGKENVDNYIEEMEICGEAPMVESKSAETVNLKNDEMVKLKTTDPTTKIPASEVSTTVLETANCAASVSSSAATLMDKMMTKQSSHIAEKNADSKISVSVATESESTTKSNNCNKSNKSQQKDDNVQNELLVSRSSSISSKTKPENVKKPSNTVSNLLSSKQQPKFIDKNFRETVLTKQEEAAKKINPPEPSLAISDLNRMSLPTMHLDIPCTVTISGFYKLIIINEFIPGLCGSFSKVKLIKSQDILLWEYMFGCIIIGHAFNDNLVALATDNGNLYLTDIKSGKFIFPPLILNNKLSNLLMNDNRLLTITNDGILNLWDLKNMRSIINNSQSVLPLLKISSSNPIVTIRKVLFSADGWPMMVLSNGKSFLFSTDLNCWMLIGDNTNPIVSYSSQQVRQNAMRNIMQQESNNNKLPLYSLQNYLASSIPSKVSQSTGLNYICTSTFLEQQVSAAIALKSAIEYKHWLLELVRFLLQQGESRRLRSICEELIGPIHKFANFNDTILGLSKHDLLKAVLKEIGGNTHTQRLFTEFNDQLNLAKPN